MFVCVLMCARVFVCVRVHLRFVSFHEWHTGSMTMCLFLRLGDITVLNFQFVRDKPDCLVHSGGELGRGIRFTNLTAREESWPFPKERGEAGEQSDLAI